MMWKLQVKQWSCPLWVRLLKHKLSVSIKVATKNVPIEFENKNFVIKHYPENSPSGQLCEKFSWMESESDLINARKNVLKYGNSIVCLVIVSWIFFWLFSFNNVVRFVLFSKNNWTARILITRILSLCNDSMCFRWQHVRRLLNA